MKESIKVAVGQIFIEIDKEQQNLDRILKFIDVASSNNADIIAFPECSNNGYVFRDVDHAFYNATLIPGPFTNKICCRAREKRIHVIVGVSERGDYPDVFNSALLIDNNGVIIGKYRKIYLATSDQIWFRPSQLGFPVFATELGNIGIFICADGRIFENARSLSLGGADIIFDVTNWFHPVQVNINTPARAIENGVWLVAANKVGYECLMEDSWMTEAIGTSFIMNPKGEFIVKAAPSKEEIIYGVVYPEESRKKGVGNGNLNNLFRDRRPELYQSLVQPMSSLPISSIVKEVIIPEDFCIQAVALQTRGECDWAKGNKERILSRVEKSSYLLSHLIVLPEVFTGGEALNQNVIQKYAEPIPGPTTEDLSRISQKYRNYITGSLIEKAEGKLFNTAFLVGPDGYIGKYRKTHLWQEEVKYLSPGDMGFPIFKTNFGNLGIMIGYDGFFPEVARILTLHGADLIAWPASWDMEVYPAIFCPVRSVDNRVFIVAATKVGNGMVGQSMITDPGGAVLSKGSKDKEQFVRSKLDIFNSRSKKLFANTSVIFDRKPEYYENLCSIRSNL